MIITEVINGSAGPSPEKNDLSHGKFGALLSPDHHHYDDSNCDNFSPRRNSSSSISSSNHSSNNSTPHSTFSPWSQHSPYVKSPWVNQFLGSSSSSDHESKRENNITKFPPKHGLIGSLFREEGHIYSLAAAGDFLFTGSESKNVRVWKNLKDFSGFKFSSGLVKAIVVLGDKIFTGHRDGKIRVWTLPGDNRSSYNRIGTLPKTSELLVKSINPRNYVEATRKRVVPWIKHYDTVSCMCVDSDQSLLYSGSWDKTLKVWRITDFKCLESIQAHDDALNAVVVAFDGMVFTGSADGTVKAWRRKMVGKRTKHLLVEVLLKQQHAVTSLAVSAAAGVVYAGSSDGLVNFWERENKCMAYGGVLRGHKLAVLCLAVAGNLVMSGSTDKSICVWRRDVGGKHSCLAVLTGHDGPVKCLVVEKDTSKAAEEEEDKWWIVYSGSLDKSVKIWRISEDAAPSRYDTGGPRLSSRLQNLNGDT